MYYDKRFQQDHEFPLFSFNIEQIKAASAAGAFLSNKPKFQNLVNLLNSIDRTVFADLTKRLQRDPATRPESDEEKKCFRVLHELDMVNGHVPGSITSKKYQRNELWSLISYLGAPSWFLTFAPADNDHPVCLYYAGCDTAFDNEKISLLKSSDRFRQVAQNPVASARFFHFLVKLLIEEILAYGKDTPGLFGDVNAYYGTVEQ
ncbi:hypothetical protein EXIGLDRAFT_606909, partial [Exidia glandulosa HHB12029]